MAKNSQPSRNDMLFWARAAIAIFALLVAAGHLAYAAMSSGSSFSFPSNSVHGGTGGTVTSGSGTPTPMGAPAFNAMGFWFDLEVVAYVVIAMVFLLGLRTWYPLAILFNAFNLGIYFLSGVTAIPGITQHAFPSRFMLSPTLSTINIIIVGWVIVLVLGLVLMKYDPGTELDRMLAIKKQG